jgi:hypothetical protein
MAARIKVAEFMEALPFRQCEYPALLKKHGISHVKSTSSAWKKRGRIPAVPMAALIKEAKKQGCSLRMEDFYVSR